MVTQFIVASKYTREQVADLIGLPADRRKGGNWTTGYDERNGEVFIFTNVGVAGRTGHDYPNRWDGKDLVWYGKTRAQRGQEQIDRIISNEVPVHVFWRGSDRAPFTYAGLGLAVDVTNDMPIQVTWNFDDQVPPPPALPTVGSPKWRRGPPPRVGRVVSVLPDGPAEVYLLRLAGASGVLPVPDGQDVIKVGMSNDVSRRLLELNAGFPPGSIARWTHLRSIPQPTARAAWMYEGAVLERLRQDGHWIGGEFAMVPHVVTEGLLR